MGSDDDTRGYLESLHGAVASLAEETRLRMGELFEELAAMRATVDAATKRLDALAEAQERVTEGVTRMAGILDEDGAGTLSRIRAEMEIVRGELAETRARVVDSELSVLDALTIGRERAAKRAAGEVSDNG